MLSKVVVDLQALSTDRPRLGQTEEFLDRNINWKLTVEQVGFSVPPPEPRRVSLTLYFRGLGSGEPACFSMGVRLAVVGVLDATAPSVDASAGRQEVVRATLRELPSRCGSKVMFWLLTGFRLIGVDPGEDGMGQFAVLCRKLADAIEIE